MEKLTLQFLGEDFWSRPVYEDQNGRIWKDTNLGDVPLSLCTATSNAFDGEPDTPIEYIKKYQGVKVEIVGRENEPTNYEKECYEMLGRLQSDCNYYLGYGGRDKSKLWALDEKAQIEEMKRLYNSFSDDKKPEWLTYEDILNYEKMMIEA